MVEADGETVLSCKQALDAAIEWFRKVEKPGFLEAAALTVQTAVDEYSAMRDARDSARAPGGPSGPTVGRASRGTSRSTKTLPASASTSSPNRTLERGADGFIG
jgi:hypothetical protein